MGVHLGSAFLGVLYLAAMDYALHYALKRDKMVRDACVRACARSRMTACWSQRRTAYSRVSAMFTACPVQENGIYEPVSPYTSYNSAYPFENGQFFRVSVTPRISQYTRCQAVIVLLPC